MRDLIFKKRKEKPAASLSFSQRLTVVAKTKIHTLLFIPLLVTSYSTISYNVPSLCCFSLFPSSRRFSNRGGRALGARFFFFFGTNANLGFDSFRAVV